MRFILIILMTATMLSCKGDMEHRLKGGMVITVKGDTIKFYGGRCTLQCTNIKDAIGGVQQVNAIFSSLQQIAEKEVNNE